MKSKLTLIILLSLTIFTSACFTHGKSHVVFRDTDFLIVKCGSNETFETLAEKYLNDASKGFRIRNINNQLKIKVVDSGEGYSLDHQQLLKDQENHGRGLLLTQKLCDKMTVSDEGRAVEVIYKLK